MNRITLINKAVKPTLFLLLLMPVIILAWSAAQGSLGANPIEAVTHETGLWALRLLLLTLAITPLKMLFGWGVLARFRRMVGVYSFFYAALHLTTYAWLDQGLSWTHIIDDVIDSPYITVGFATFILLIPLAATSFNRAISYLGGKRWKKLHKLVYLCALGGVTHYLWLVKADTLSPIIYAAVFAGLMLFRVPKKYTHFSKLTFQNLSLKKTSMGPLQKEEIRNET